MKSLVYNIKTILKVKLTLILIAIVTSFQVKQSKLTFVS